MQVAIGLLTNTIKILEYSNYLFIKLSLLSILRLMKQHASQSYNINVNVSLYNQLTIQKFSHQTSLPQTQSSSTALKLRSRYTGHSPWTTVGNHRPPTFLQIMNKLHINILLLLTMFPQTTETRQSNHAHTLATPFREEYFTKVVAGSLVQMNSICKTKHA